MFCTLFLKEYLECVFPLLEIDFLACATRAIGRLKDIRQRAAVRRNGFAITKQIVGWVIGVIKAVGVIVAESEQDGLQEFNALDLGQDIGDDLLLTDIEPLEFRCARWHVIDGVGRSALIIQDGNFNARPRLSYPIHDVQGRLFIRDGCPLDGCACRCRTCDLCFQRTHTHIRYALCFG